MPSKPSNPVQPDLDPVRANAVIRLKPKRERSVLKRHPWIFSGAIAHADALPGEIAPVESHQGAFLGWGYYNAKSQIQARLLTWDQAPPDAAWWREQIRQAIHRRQLLLSGADTNAYRLVNAESDGLPGLIVDRYDNWLVLQALTLGIDQRKQFLADALLETTGARGIWERSDERVRRLEGLDECQGLLAGEPPPILVKIRENGFQFLVDIVGGQKSGAYLDQRDNRKRLGEYAASRSVLNCFAYTGGFSVYAAAAGAKNVTSVDSSRDALDLGQKNYSLNGLPVTPEDWVMADVPEFLRDCCRARRQFDLIVLDPPKFVQAQRHLDAGCRGYKDINFHALKLLAPGGLLFTFSCSGLVSADLFQKIVFGAAVDAGVAAQIISPLAQGVDHPVALTFPEGAYLKGLLIQRM